MQYIEKDYCNRRIHLGLVASCNNSDQYGLIYGFRCPPYNGREEIFENKIFYFKKDPEFEIADNTLVSYRSFDYNGFIPKVDYVYPISSLVIHGDKRGTMRADGVYHDEETWRLINEGIPFFDYEPRNSCCIYYPLISGNVCTIWRGLFGAGLIETKESIVYEMYRELTSINYTGWPTLDEIAGTIAKFKEHIDSINAFEIIDEFEVMKICRYISRVGRDDHYFEDLYQCLPNDEAYLSYLLPTKQETVFYDDNAYPSDGYKDDVILLREETMQAREMAKAEYTKEKHLAFLVSDFFSNNLEKKERTEILSNRLSEEFDVKNAEMVTSEFNGIITDDFVSLINEYNNSTVIGPLEI